ncbi:MAG: hypothetical protein V9G14_09810 [Cypionkella sp.]
MNLRDAMENYVVWRQAHGAKFNTARNLLRQFLRHADGEDGCDAVTQAQVASFLAGPVTPHRENKVYALTGFWQFAISRGYATCFTFARPGTQIALPASALHLHARRASASS